ncbi:putative sulfate exporter family transporter [Streptomyces sp. AD681]|uniref:YeiH family protein n=1 Tax=Streptomyces sp. AD681 TaxID=3019069 RepID=UPI0022F14804|nr:putative sulfate exporter family transporter [Streptomyces sp. AD681]MDA5147045.1 putative sulfate exporter family transporter [Streptomyces sp. AD681]
MKRLMIGPYQGHHQQEEPPPRRLMPDWGPGILSAAAATTVAYAVAHSISWLNPAIVAVVLGALVTNLRLHRPVLRAGTRLVGKRLLRWAVVLLGLQLSLPELARLGGRGLTVVVLTVAVTFVGTQLIARALGLPSARALLVATGFSICGASAIAAMEPVADGDEEDTGVAVALVTLCGTLAILVLPALRGPLGLTVAEFGSWVGASVHDVGQTVATAQRVPGSLTTAVVVKLTRVVLLAPLVASAALSVRRRHRVLAGATGGAGSSAEGTSGEPGAGRRMPPPVPLFVVGFLGAIALTSTGLLPGPVLDCAQSVQSALLVAALFGLGTGIHLPALVRTGGRSLALGLMSWVLVASVAYAGVRLAAL